MVTATKANKNRPQESELSSFLLPHFADRFNEFNDDFSFAELFESSFDHFGMLLIVVFIFCGLSASGLHAQTNIPLPQPVSSLKIIGIPADFWRLLPAPTLASRSSAKLQNNGKKKYNVSQIGDRGIGGGLNFYSLDREIQLGRELSQEIELHTKLLKDPVVNEYINRIGQNLVRNSDAKVPFTIKVIDSDEVNAFALPGGFFYINTGLIMAVEDEAELAGVMAHEIAHVAARHATKTATKQEIWNFASIPLLFVAGPAGLAIRDVASIAVPMSFLKFGRNAEREADLLGLQYQYAAGYDPAAITDFFERLTAKEKKKKNFIARAFATHPMNEDRIKRAQHEIDTMLPPNNQYLISTSEFNEIHDRLTRLNSNRLSIHPTDSNKPTLRKSTSK